uniref:Serine aminopeptidase S33 domain-containing protein n=1 Tax=Globisporangium ultimum (strain ATCC 200006 / CBS 805.95 / DAOM BR144) TaxID=431595 RepID=K3WQW8_GLOUD
MKMMMVVCLRPSIRKSTAEAPAVSESEQAKGGRDTPAASGVSFTPKRRRRAATASGLRQTPLHALSPALENSSMTSAIAESISMATTTRKMSRVDALRANVPSSWRAEHMPPHLRHSEGTRTNTRGQKLSYVTMFPPETTPVRGVVFFLHGINEHCRRYYHLYEQLCENGFGVLAYDLLSHGQSDTCEHRIRAHAKRFHYFVDDTNEMLAFAKEVIFPTFLKKEVYPSLPPLILSGMSFGTLVSLHTVLSEKHEFSGVVLVAPAVSVEWTTTLRVQSVFAKPLSTFLPKVKLVPGVNREWICRDKVFMEDFENDPLTVGGDLTSRMGEQSLSAMIELKKDVRVEQPDSKFCALPILIMMGSNDKVTSLSIATEFAERIANHDKEFKVFDGPYHALFDDPDKDAVFDHLIHWLHARYPEPKATTNGFSDNDNNEDKPASDVKAAVDDEKNPSVEAVVVETVVSSDATTAEKAEPQEEKVVTLEAVTTVEVAASEVKATGDVTAVEDAKTSVVEALVVEAAVSASK